MTADALINFVFKARNQAESEVKKVTADLEKVRKKAEQLKKVGKSLMAKGAVMSAFITAPTLLFFKKLTDAAGDLNETISKTEAIFGQSAEALNSWAREAAQAMGYSQREALDFASRYGGALKEIGRVSQETAAEISKRLTQLGADLNSFFNREDAGDAIASALTGEFEPLKKFNVIVNEAILKQKALTLGLYAGKGALSAQAKQAATLAVIFDQTTDAQGDFLKTADGAANASRRLAAQQENLSSQLGTFLLPYKLKLIEVMSRIITVLSSLTPETQKWILGVIAAAAAIGPLLIGVGALVIVLSKLQVALFVTKIAFLALWSTVLLPITAILGGLVAIGAGIAALSGDFQRSGLAMVDGLSPVQKAILFLQKGFHFLKIAVAATAVGVVQIGVAFFKMEQAVREAIEGSKSLMAELANSMVKTFNQAVTKVVSLINKATSLVTKGIEGTLNALVTAFEASINNMIAGVNLLTKFIPGVDQIGSADFGRVALDAPQIDFDGVDFTPFETKMKVVSERSGLAYLEGLKKGLIDETSDLLNNIPDGSEMAESARVIKEQLEAGSKSLTAEAIRQAAALGGAVPGGGAVGGGVAGAGGGRGAGRAAREERGQQNVAQREAEQIARALDSANLAAGVLRGSFDGISSSIEGLIRGTMTWTDAVLNVANAIVTELITSFAQMAAAWIVKHLLMSKTIQAENAATAASAAPAAALQSVVSYGGAAVIGAAAVIAALAAVSGAFQSGGYTGNGGVSTVAGVVHGREFVNDAPSTAMNREFLEYLGDGGSAAGVVAGAYEAGRGSNETTIIMVDSMAKAKRMSQGMKGEVQIVVREEIQRRRG